MFMCTFGAQTRSRIGLGRIQAETAGAKWSGAIVETSFWIPVSTPFWCQRFSHCLDLCSGKHGIEQPRNVRFMQSKRSRVMSGKPLPVRCGTCVGSVWEPFKVPLGGGGGLLRGTLEPSQMFKGPSESRRGPIRVICVSHRCHTCHTWEWVGAGCGFICTHFGPLPAGFGPGGPVLCPFSGFGGGRGDTPVKGTAARGCLGPQSGLWRGYDLAGVLGGHG